ncbi:MAG: hypothetical protein H0T63_04375, partial [Pyrinomonadaceae bacterium]|nr:hypothetical protein [Pyrinomonadaceae bacterium]
MPSNRSVVNLSDARRQALSADATQALLAQEIEATRGLLDGGRAGEAEARLRQLIKVARGDVALAAQARCLLSAALEMQGRYRESLEAVQMYEATAARQPLGNELAVALLVQLGLAYNYTGDHPKAITLLYAMLRETPAENGPAQMGALYAALARVYR